MTEAGKDLAAALEDAVFGPLSCQVVPNTTGRPTFQAAEAKSELMRQITSPVCWVQTVESLLALGVDTFIECGPKQVLAGLIKKTAPKEVKVLGVENPASLQAVLAAL
jgi:[acyl-carrier-protein] S-malonyltransferase